METHSPHSPPHECGLNVVTCFQQVEWSWINVTWLLRLDHKRHCNFFLIDSLWGHLLGASQMPCHDDTQAAYGEAHMVRNEGILTEASEDLELSANSHMGEPLWKQINPQLQSNLQMTVAPADILNSTTWETLSENYLAKLLLNPWLTETVR